MASGPPIEMPIVVPSGSALATASVPRLPLAPGLFSITKVWPSVCCRRSPISRATMSGVEPGPNGTTILTVLVGHSCAAAGGSASHSPSRASVSLRIPESLLAIAPRRPSPSAKAVCRRRHSCLFDFRRMLKRKPDTYISAVGRPPCLQTCHGFYCVCSASALHLLCLGFAGGPVGILVVGLLLFIGAHVFV